jgi:hypothetical protein
MEGWHMETLDYHVMEKTTGTVGTNLARGARATKGVIIPEVINPLGASVGVGVVWGGIAGLTSMKRYRDGKISGKDAVLTTVGESVGMGLAAGLGILASNVARASLLMTATTAFAPFVVGVIVTTGAKILWDMSTKKHILSAT